MPNRPARKRPKRNRERRGGVNVTDPKTTPEQQPAPGDGHPATSAETISPQELAVLQKRAAERDQYLDLLQRTRSRL